MADNALPHPQLEGLKSGSLEGMQLHGCSQMKVPSDFCPPEPRENKLLSEGIELLCLVVTAVKETLDRG